MKLKTTLFAAAATLAIAPAAHAYEGWYGAIGAGLSYPQPDADFEANSGPVLFDSELDYESGVGIYSALGYAFGNDFRSEFEYSYRNNNVRHLPGDGLGFSGLPSQARGDLTTNQFMLNLIRDFDAGSVVTPFLGLGAGVQLNNLELRGSNPGAVGGPFALTIDDREVSPAAQAIAGLGVALADNLSLDLTYRFIVSRAGNIEGDINGFDSTFGLENITHAAYAGLRWNFGASPAPAPAPVVQYKDCWDGSSVPVSAECPPQLVEEQAEIAEPIQFTVYFDYDKSNLTPEASNLVREAASRAQQFDVDTVVVTGNTDTSGGAAYNQRLSERRASVVRDALIANGVPADSIRVNALGETNLAKPTADGVREPLNRRTDVVISFE